MLSDTQPRTPDRPYTDAEENPILSTTSTLRATSDCRTRHNVIPRCRGYLWVAYHACRHGDRRRPDRPPSLARRASVEEGVRHRGPDNRPQRDREPVTAASARDRSLRRVALLSDRSVSSGFVAPAGEPIRCPCAGSAGPRPYRITKPGPRRSTYTRSGKDDGPAFTRRVMSDAPSAHRRAAGRFTRADTPFTVEVPPGQSGWEPRIVAVSPDP